MSQQPQLEPRGLIRPLSLRGVPPWVTYFFSLIGVIYLLNPTFGLFELIPDALPFVGNLDEGGAFLLVWYGLVEFFEGRKYRKLRRRPEPGG